MVSLATDVSKDGEIQFFKKDGNFSNGATFLKNAMYKDQSYDNSFQLFEP